MPVALLILATFLSSAVEETGLPHPLAVSTSSQKRTCARNTTLFRTEPHTSVTDTGDPFPADWASESEHCSDKEGLFQIILTTKGTSDTDTEPLEEL